MTQSEFNTKKKELFSFLKEKNDAVERGEMTQQQLKKYLPKFRQYRLMNELDYEGYELFKAGTKAVTAQHLLMKLKLKQLKLQLP